MVSVEACNNDVYNSITCVPFAADFQAAGHASGFLSLPSGLLSSVIRKPAEHSLGQSLPDPTKLLVKPCTSREGDWYDQVYEKHCPLSQCIPRFYGHLPLPDESLHRLQILQDTGEQASSQIITDAVVLENLTCYFVRPSILDYKLGNILYDPADASKEKAARMILKAQKTTSLRMAGRIAGMKVWDGTTASYQVYDKHYGRALTEDTIFDKGLAVFLKPLLTTGNAAIKAKVLNCILHQLREMIHLLHRTYVQMRGASVLILYEGDVNTLTRYTDTSSTASDEASAMKMPSKHIAICKLIDFAHTRFVLDQAPGDQGVILGLSKLVDMLSLLR